MMVIIDGMPRPATPEEVADILVKRAAASVLRVPATVSQAQLRIALHRRGLLAAVEAAVRDTEDVELAIRWNAPTVERNSPLLVAVTSQLRLSSMDVDQIFREAATL